MMDGADLLRAAGPDEVEVLLHGRNEPVAGLWIHGDRVPPGPGCLIVDGISHGADQTSTVRQAVAFHAPGVLLRAPVAPAAQQLARESGLCLGALSAEVDIASFLASVALAWRASMAPRGSAAAHQRILDVTDELARLLQAPLTIEDDQNRVVAYATVPGGAFDEARMQTILARAVPANVVQRLRASGTFRRLHHNHEPFLVPSSGTDLLPRVVVPMRVGPELVGSLWVICEDDTEGGVLLEAVTRDTGDIHRLRRAAALCLLQLRYDESRSARYSQEQVRAALRGTGSRVGAEHGGDPSTRERVAIALPGDAVRVVAFASPAGASASDAMDAWRPVLRRHSWADPILADVDGVLYAIVTEGRGPGSWHWLRALDARVPLGVFAASRPTGDVTELPRRRTEALELLEVLRRDGAASGRFEDLWPAVVLTRAHEATRSFCPDEVRALQAAESTGTRRGDLLSTLRVWLMHWGDYSDTASALGVHPNTVRQRIGKVRQMLATVDLDRPEHRFAIVLLLSGDPDATRAPETRAE